MTIVALLLLSALVVGTTYWQAWAESGLSARQDNAIQRVAQFTVRRGLIYAADGSLLAARRAVKTKGQTFYFRRYPGGDLAPQLVGYSTQSRARAGLERSMNSYLTASNSHLNTVVRRTLDRLKGTTVTGNNLVLTLRPEAQRAALKALDGNCGAAVALEPSTGRVLAMASTPTYDPSLVEGRFGQIARSARNAKCGSPAPLVNRATDGLFVARLDVQDPDRGRGAGLGDLQRELHVRRQGLLRGIRQEGLELRRPERPRGLRARRLHDRARALDQRGVLRDRQEPGAAEAARVREEVRLLQGPPARDAVHGAHAERPVRPRPPLPAARPEPGRPGPARLRTGAPSGHAAPDGDGGRRDRQRRHRDEAVLRREDHGAGRREPSSAPTHMSFRRRSRRRRRRR